MTKRGSRKRGPIRRFLHSHSLSLVFAAILLLWIVLYAKADAETKWGEFFGNAVADWSGSIFLVIGTKLLYETGSVESRRPRGHFANPVIDFLYHHSLTIFLIVTGAVWAFLFFNGNAGSKWGHVYGNILSEWVQMIGIVFLTKRLLEHGSKESH